MLLASSKEHSDNISARAKTGSGKTAAYVLPILQSILKRRSSGKSTQSATAIILVPTKELANQVTKSFTTFAAFCAKDLRIANLTPQISEPAQRALLATTPDIVISTPSRVSQHLNSSTLIVADLAHLVIDEADLVLSYGYSDDFQNIVTLLTQGVQTFLASATLTTEVDILKGLFCRDPVVLDLEEEEKEAPNHLNQYVVRCGEDEKFLLLFALFKLKLVKGKAIVFVADVDRCYRVKLFLEQFGIRSCVLNSELPVNCRIHVVEEYNKNVYDILIASDEHEVVGTDDGEQQGKRKKRKSDKTKKTNAIEEDGDAGDVAAKEEVEDEVETPGADVNDHTASTKPKKSKKSKSKSTSSSNLREFGISRGIDFHHVSLVLNFDLPTTPSSYTHRIGRTARASRTGLALSFVIPASQHHKHKHLSTPTTEYDEVVLSAITNSQAKRGAKLERYDFDMQKLEGFRYRVSSCLKDVTPGAIRDVRAKELKAEMLRSERLKRHFEENPEDRQFLRHDAEGRPSKVRGEMRHVPEYLMPQATNSAGEAGESGIAGVANQSAAAKIGFVGFKKESENRIRAARARNKLRGGRKGIGKKSKKVDVLKSFKAK